jgi:4-alpha-glucanotransferase
MQLHFFIKYGTGYGENITICYKNNIDVEKQYYTLNYVDSNLWHGVINTETLNISNNFDYEVLLKKDDEVFFQRYLASAIIDLNKYKTECYNIIHENFSAKEFIKLNSFKPYKEVFKNEVEKKDSTKSPKKVTNIFEIEYPVLQQNKFVCITGNATCMNGFDEAKPIIFEKTNNYKSSIALDLSDEKAPLEFKLGIYDTDKKKIVEYEQGANRIITKIDKAEAISILHLNYSFNNLDWKGAGINVPVFSLRTNDGWGIGDFTDINLLVDYAAKVGLKLIQLLPINDTTAIYTDKDSYPYSAISSFAYHPKLLNVKKLLSAYDISLLKTEEQEIERLNKLSYSDHSAVLTLKIDVLKRIFEKDKNAFLKEKEWLSFFNDHGNWLTPFAAFCTLRDKNNTADFSAWGEYAVYNEAIIKKFTSEKSEHYSTILFWYFVQYHLHIQIKDAVEYAHSKGIILKADLPIGVGRLSADTWEYPTLFVMGMQAGAPPDAFSGSGQNWSFPTYNIGEMAKDNFAWFRKRMGHLQTYFDAVRIDHVLGIFRIWSIPMNQVEGTMGKFVPAIPIYKDAFYNAGLHFDEYRYCEPYITEEILFEKFGNDIGHVKDIFFAYGKFKEEFNDQRKIENYFIQHPENIKWQQGLFDLISNVLLFKDESGYHFRINMFQISTYKNLSAEEKYKIDKLYHHYFFEMQNDLWRKEGELKLEMLRDSTDILLCAEDLGMVPDFTDEVLKNLDILSLQVQQMPKDSSSAYSDTAKAKYESVVMPATHDMSTIRLWWEENRGTTQSFFNEILQEHGGAPFYCEPWVAKKIIEKHLQSPAMWSIFLAQDILAINGNVRRKDPTEERINNPSNPNHVWNYRMHLSLEELMKHNELNNELYSMIKESGR